MSIWLGNQRLDGGSARNVGDIFYTKRKDSGLGGAVECNGGTYSTADYTGAGSIGELLAGGKLDYISLSDYATAISTKGWCDKIGWDGGTTVRVPTLTPHIIQKNNIPVVGNSVNIGLTDGTNNFGLKTANFTTTLVQALPYGGKVGDAETGTGLSTNGMIGLTTDGTNSGIIADTTNTAQLRVMFQLFNSTTDEAVATVGTVVAQVGELNSHRVVDFQIPTAGNGYTWYRKYADGWVEQGGLLGSAGTYAWRTITMPITMSDTHYTVVITGAWDDSSGNGSMLGNSKTTTSFNTYATNANNNGSWYVCGMAA